MRLVHVCDQFSGQAAVQANGLALSCIAFLEARPKQREFDRWGRASFLSNVFWKDGAWVLTVKELAAMSRVKGKSNGSGSAAGNGGFGSDFTWVNIPLDADDEARCAEVAADAPAASHGFVGLLAYGLEISLKRRDNGEFMACAYGAAADGRKFGISAWASTAEDAIASLLVKWHDRLNASLDTAASQGVKPRFR